MNPNKKSNSTHPVQAGVGAERRVRKDNDPTAAGRGDEGQVCLVDEGMSSR